MGTEGRTGTVGSEGADASLDVVSQAQNQFRRELDQVADTLAKQVPRRLALPQPANPFIVNESPTPDGVLDTIAVNLPPATDIGSLTITYRKVSETAAKNKTASWDDINANESAAQHVERQITKVLDNDTAYGLVSIMVKGDFVSTRKSRNPDPPDDVNFLTTWTTGSFFSNDPSKPDIGLILENKTDDTTKAFDAFIRIRIYAPINGFLTAYTGTVTINNTTTVTGTQSFAGLVVIGQLINVSNQTRRVTNVVGSTITVDVSFKGSASGLSLTYGVPHTWDSAQISKVIARFQLTDDANSTPIGETHDFTAADGGQSSIDFRVNGFVADRKYNWNQNILKGGLTGRRHVNAASTQTFIAGGFADSTAGLPELTSVAYQYDTTEPYNASLRAVSVVAAQPNPPIGLDRAEFRRFKLGGGTMAVSNGFATLTGTGTTFLTDLVIGYQVLVGAQTFTVLSITNDLLATATANSTATASGQDYYVSKGILDEKNLRRLKFHPATGGQIQINWRDISTKKLLKHTFRTTIFAQNGLSRNIDDNFTGGASGNVLDDTAVPPAPGAPNVEEFFGKLNVWVDTPPTSQMNTFKHYQYIMSTQNTPPAGDPTVGVDSVLKIKKGKGGEAFKRKLADVSSVTFYFYARAENAINWSAWSSGTSILGSVVSRPIEDFIGTAVPTPLLGLERSDTAPGSPAIANDGTHFSIDTAASAVTDFYVGDVLEVPALAAGNQVQEITAYDATNFRLTVTPGFTVTPGNSEPFRLHRGVSNNALPGSVTIRGNRGGTQVNATHFVIDAAGSATTDFYLGWSIFTPSAIAADQIRICTGYNGTTKSLTVDVAYSGTPANGIGFVLFKGNCAFAAVDQTGIVTGAPLRLWLDDDGNVQSEILPPTGESAFSLTQSHVKVYKTDGTKKKSIYISATTAPTTFWAAATGARSAQVRFQNMYRGSGSDGWSVESYYVAVPKSTATNQGYSPGANPPVEVDFQALDEYPTQRYPAY